MSKKQTPKIEKVIEKVKKSLKKGTKKVEPTVELTSFSIKATIPTMMYGNIMPEIVVSAPNLEMAQAYALPVIEDLFRTYCETPLKKHEKVTSVERKVEVPAGIVGAIGIAPGAPTVPGTAPVAPAKAPEKKDEPTGPAVKTDPYIKAENAIASAMSKEALDLVHDKIKASVKINEDDKQFLFDLIINKKWTMK